MMVVDFRAAVVFVMIVSAVARVGAQLDEEELLMESAIAMEQLRRSGYISYEAMSRRHLTQKHRGQFYHKKPPRTIVAGA